MNVPVEPWQCWANRRRLIKASSLMFGAGTWLVARSAGDPDRSAGARDEQVLTLYTFGDSILDCGHYNGYGVHPGQLIVRNDDRLFPEFLHRDLSARGPARLEHRAVDGATVTGLAGQAHGLAPAGTSVALLTVGGNDLIRGLAGGSGGGITAFERTLERFLSSLPVRPVILGTVYDPTFNDDARNFLGVPHPWHDRTTGG